MSADNDVVPINHIKFSVTTDDFILKNSAVEITEKTFYDGNGEPKLNGLFDPRMGVIDKHAKCQTCYLDYISCPGHFGHIKLAHPVFNVQYNDYIKNILFCVCIPCARILCDPETPAVKEILKITEGNNYVRNKMITDYIKVNKLHVKCQHCGAVQPVKIHNNVIDEIAFTAEWADSELGAEKFDMNAERILNLFRLITESDSAIMGYFKNSCLPHDLIMETLLVMPPCARPSVRRYNGQRSEDDITTKYYEILKQNDDLRDLLNNPEASEKQIKDNIDLLQTHINTMINNDGKSGYPESKTRAGRPIKSITKRLTGKEGRIRNNLMGKRVDFSARSVISPDANLKISELGVPRDIAMNLTFPEIVNKYNYDRMVKTVKNGNTIYPGAMSIIKNDTQDMYVIGPMNIDSIVLEYGDIVNRHLIDGDFVLFNRQPSLHRMSMMGHKIKVMKGKTFRLNVDVCQPYNADEPVFGLFILDGQTIDIN